VETLPPLPNVPPLDGLPPDAVPPEAPPPPTLEAAPVPASLGIASEQPRVVAKARAPARARERSEEGILMVE
jgi:hypothetical protein